MKLSTTLLIILAPELALSWSPSSHQRSATFTRLQVSNANDSDKPSWQDIWSYDSAMSNAYSAAFIPAEWKKSNTNDPFTNLNQVAVESSDDTSWQDIWSYDNAMSNAYSAAFIPADWIKKLPCALGLAVSNRTLPEGGIE
jgi:hypothetical protein